MKVTLSPTKRRAFLILGNKCEWCGEGIPILLEIDHIHENGKAHRAEAGYSSIEKWIIKNPDVAKEKVQLLCSARAPSKRVQDQFIS